MDYEKSIEEISKTLFELKEENKKTPIVVEGEKDKKALHKLKIDGIIITINNGLSLIDFCDEIAKRYKEIILLTDWDRKGGFLRYKIQKNLEGRVKCITKYREVFAKNTMTKTVEGIPSWINTINNKIKKYDNKRV